MYVYVYACIYIYICIYGAYAGAHPGKKQRNGIHVCIYICVYGAYAGAHPCVNDSFFPKTSIKPIRSL